MINLEQKYTPRVNPGDADYPFGSIKGDSSPGAGDGTPLSSSWGNDIEGFRQAVMVEAGETPSGQPDNAHASQLWSAMKDILRQEVPNMGWTPVEGSFELGGTITARNQILWWEAAKAWYSWQGDLTISKVVLSGSTPASAGGVASDAWVDRTDGALRGVIEENNNRTALNVFEHGFSNGDISESIWNSALLTANSLEIPWNINGLTATISTDRELPAYGVIGKASITGAALKVTRNKQKFRQAGGRLVCDTLWLSGAQYIKTEWIKANNKFLFDGNATDYGIFWCEFGFHEGLHEFDTSKGQSINENKFNFIRGGIHAYGDTLIGGYGEFNLNDFCMVDSTGANITSLRDGSTGHHVLNETSSLQLNTLRNWYAEGTGMRSCTGPWHVLASYVDTNGNSPYSMPPTSHVLFTPGNGVRNQSDYLAGNPENMAIGGCWDVLNAGSIGQPFCLSSAGGAPHAVVADATEPTGVGYKYGGASGINFSSYRMTVKTNKSGRLAVFFWMLYVSGTQSIQVENNGSPISHTLQVYHKGANNWRLYRISTPCRTDGADEVITIFHRSADSEFYIGAVFATPDKLAFLPRAAPAEMRYGITKTGSTVAAIPALPIGGRVRNLSPTLAIGDTLEWVKLANNSLRPVSILA